MTGKLGDQSFGMYAGYRVYVTAEAYVVTYKDAEFLRVYRTHHDHESGFVLLFVKLVFFLLTGKRTELRDKWAVSAMAHTQDEHDLNVALLATHGSVLEFNVVIDRGDEKAAPK